MGDEYLESDSQKSDSQNIYIMHIIFIVIGLGLLLEVHTKKKIFNNSYIISQGTSLCKL